MMKRFADWVNIVNTTSFRIIVSVIVASVLVLSLTLAIVFLKFTPSDGQRSLLNAIGGLLGAMMSLDLLQFTAKRFSDSGYVAAKQGPSPVTVEAPSTVTVTDPKVLPSAVTVSPPPVVVEEAVG